MVKAVVVDGSGGGVMGPVHSLVAAANKGISHGEGWRLRPWIWLHYVDVIFHGGGGPSAAE